MFEVFVVWSVDGPVMTTLLEFPDNADQRCAMQQWSTQDYIAQAHAVEFGEALDAGEYYEVAAIFEGTIRNWIY